MHESRDSIVSTGKRLLTSHILGCFTLSNQYKDVTAQRDSSASEARQRVKSIVVLRLSSLTQHLKG